MFPDQNTVVENQVVDSQPEAATEEALADNQVKLSDGRVVEVRETTGADEMVIAAELGDAFSPNGGGAVIFQSCLIAKAVASINGQPVPSTRGFAGYRDFLASFRSKDYNKIRALYAKINGEDPNA